MNRSVHCAMFSRRLAAGNTMSAGCKADDTLSRHRKHTLEHLSRIPQTSLK